MAKEGSLKKLASKNWESSKMTDHHHLHYVGGGMDATVYQAWIGSGVTINTTDDADREKLKELTEAVLNTEQSIEKKRKGLTIAYLEISELKKRLGIGT